MTPAGRTPRLTDLPLWRLIVLLDDTERTVGPDSETARTVARILRERMAAEGAAAQPLETEAVADA
jgi:hypothetical protein